jgi:ATP-binding cassette, subfamily B, bacterial
VRALSEVGIDPASRFRYPHEFSGGQRQRIAIARAMLKNAPIVLLDEATSALDTESELDVQAGLQSLTQGRTVLAIAHRLSTIMDFDRVIVLQNGRIVEDGSPSVLCHGIGPFGRMWRLQQRANVRSAPQAMDFAWSEAIEAAGPGNAALASAPRWPDRATG